MAQASDVMAKIDSLPLNQIADNLQQTTQRLAELSQSPETKEALQNVNDAIANLRRVSASMSRDLPTALARMTHAVQSAQAVIGQEGEVASQPQTSTLPSTLYEVRQAARSIRELANELERNPQALLTGR
jgi:paraquat-inducible protein B